VRPEARHQGVERGRGVVRLHGEEHAPEAVGQAVRRDRAHRRVPVTGGRLHAEAAGVHGVDVSLVDVHEQHVVARARERAARDPADCAGPVDRQGRHDAGSITARGRGGQRGFGQDAARRPEQTTARSGKRTGWPVTASAADGLPPVLSTCVSSTSANPADSSSDRSTARSWRLNGVA
jgi:hypothetical protein